MLRAERKETLHIISQDRGGGRIIRIAENEKIITVFQRTAEVVHIQMKIIFLSQMIVFLCASGEGKFSGIFGVSRTEYESMLWRECFDQQRDQFAGTVAGQDVFCRDTAVSGNSIPQ